MAERNSRRRRSIVVLRNRGCDCTRPWCLVRIHLPEANRHLRSCTLRSLGSRPAWLPHRRCRRQCTFRIACMPWSGGSSSRIRLRGRGKHPPFCNARSSCNPPLRRRCTRCPPVCSAPRCGTQPSRRNGRPAGSRGRRWPPQKWERSADRGAARVRSTAPVTAERPPKAVAAARTRKEQRRAFRE